VYEFREGKVKPYLGGIEYFLEQRKLDSMRTLEKRSEDKAAAAVIAAAAPSKHSFAERKELEKDNKRIKNRISKVEEEIAALETEIAVLDAALLDPEKFKELSKDPNYYTKYEAKKQALEKVMTEWEELAEQAETTEQQLNALS
jgi:ATP-binding cassette subfamily F protein 3